MRGRPRGSGQSSPTVLRPRRWLDRPTAAYCVPARRERGRVEALGGSERLVGAPVRVAPEHSAQQPLARQPDEVELVVAQSELALRMEVEVDRQLLDQRGIGGGGPRPPPPGGRPRGRAPGPP